MVQILAVQVAPPGNSEAHITSVRWYNPEDGQISVATVPVMVDFISGKGGVAYVFDGQIRSDVVVAAGPSPYLTTHPDGLGMVRRSMLSLPRF